MDPQQPVVYEWADTLTEADTSIIHPGYESMRANYTALGIDYDLFFNKYISKMCDDLDFDKDLFPDDSSYRTYYLMRARSGLKPWDFQCLSKTNLIAFTLSFLWSHLIHKG
jgi:hypothetical protein